MSSALSPLSSALLLQPDVFMVYLNDDFEGGHTTFLVTPEISVKPLTGMALFFQHPLIHEGSLVTKGVKYVLRTDVMYRTKH